MAKLNQSELRAKRGTVLDDIMQGKPRLSHKMAQDMCRALGCSLRKRDGEYRVAYLTGSLEEREARAYYTTDLLDACNTANAMYDWLQQHKGA